MVRSLDYSVKDVKYVYNHLRNRVNEFRAQINYDSSAEQAIVHALRIGEGDPEIIRGLSLGEENPFLDICDRIFHKIQKRRANPVKEWLDFFGPYLCDTYTFIGSYNSSFLVQSMCNYMTSLMSKNKGDHNFWGVSYDIENKMKSSLPKINTRINEALILDDSRMIRFVVLPEIVPLNEVGLDKYVEQSRNNYVVITADMNVISAFFGLNLDELTYLPNQSYIGSKIKLTDFKKMLGEKFPKFVEHSQLAEEYSELSNAENHSNLAGECLEWIEVFKSVGSGAHLKLSETHSGLSNKYLRLSKRYSQLAEQQSKLTEKHSQLAKKYFQLAKKHIESTKDFELGKMYSKISECHINLSETKQNSKLDQAYSELAGKYSQLAEKHTELAQEYPELAEEYSKLARQHIQLDRKHAQLAKKLFRITVAIPDYLNRWQANLESDYLNLEGKLAMISSKKDRSKMVSRVQKMYYRPSVENGFLLFKDGEHAIPETQWGVWGELVESAAYMKLQGLYDGKSRLKYVYINGVNAKNQTFNNKFKKVLVNLVVKQQGIHMDKVEKETLITRPNKLLEKILADSTGVNNAYR